MKDNFKILNNVEMDLDKYEDLNIDKDKLKKKMRGQIKSKSKLKKKYNKGCWYIYSWWRISCGRYYKSILGK